MARRSRRRPADPGQLLPLLDEVNETYGVEPEVVLADSAYCSEADFGGAGARGQG